MNKKKSQPLTVIVPVDFSKVSKHGLQLARCISEQYPLKVHLIHWVPAQSPVYRQSSGEIDENRSQLKDVFTLKLIEKQTRKISKWARKFSGPDLAITEHVKIGDMASGLEEAVESLKADLVIMGTTGEHTLPELFKGNHVEQVVRSVSCPILSVKKHHKAFNAEDILMVVDMSDQFDSIARTVKLAKLLGSKIHLLVVNPSNLNDKKEALMQMKLIIEKFNIQDFTMNYVSGEDEYSSITSLAKIKSVDMIALFTENQNLFIDFITDDSTKNIINKAERPVLTINTDNC